jgi:alkanesulfonate monooxygenase SsuD/methylene tetrahydromethanopterin reductase-like flavin-dependent oxidoreductase (luciferase family)
VLDVRVGIVILPECRWSEAQRLWQRAEEYGFSHAWTYDHLGWRDLVEGPWFDAVATLTGAAMVTSRIRLGTHVASANFRQPVLFAREITSLDDISGGRFLLGLGAGGIGFDATVLGEPQMSPGMRVHRFSEFVELLDLILTNDQTTWRGQYYEAVDARSTPGCIQVPRVPFVVAANGSRSIRLAARFGQGWITTGENSDDLEAWWQSIAVRVRRFEEALTSCGRDPSTVDRYLSLDAAPIYSLSSLSFFVEAMGRARQLGFTDVVSHWPRSTGWYAGDESVLDKLASDVLPQSARL